MKMSKDISRELWIILNRTRYLIYKDRQKELNKYGLSVRHAGVLATITRLGGRATIGDLARELSLEPHSISELLARMETQELIKKVKDAKRKNVFSVELTEKGEQAHSESRKLESVKDIMAALNDNEKAELWSHLSKIRNRAMERLGIKSEALFPPSDYRDL